MNEPSLAPPRWRFAVGLSAVTAVALALRVHRLASVPNAAHDEGNWLLAAWERAHGHPVPLPPDARFVTDLFAWMMALAMRLFGDSIASARSVPVAASLVGIVAVALLARRIAGALPALVLAALLAVHPWAVLWSRNVVTPYALSLSLAALAPLLAHRAWNLPSPRSSWWRVACGQCLALGFQFSPLALIPALGVAAQLLSDPVSRARLRERSTLLAALLAAAHVAPVVVGAARVAQHGSTRPSSHLDHLGSRLQIFDRTLAGVLSGEATLRDFTTATLPLPLELLAGAVAVGLIVLALVRGRDPLRRLAIPHLAAALVGLPLLLAPMRQWHMPSVDAERYGFVLLAPAALLVASLAATRLRWIALAAALALALGPTRRGAVWFLRGGGPDRGVFLDRDGAGGRRWKVTALDVAVVDQIIAEASALDGGARVTVVTADYVLHPIYFANAAHGHRIVELNLAPLSPRPGERMLFVRWSDGVFARGFWPRADVLANEALTARMRAPDLTGLRLVRALRQPDGEALIELWTAQAP